jgi:uncharacterized protein (DUF58 family)
MNRAKAFASRHFQHWLQRRIPTARAVTLDHRRIFIFPTRQGFAFLGLVLVMLLAAINYQNNMAFALCFFMLSLFFVTVHHSYANLSGLKLRAVAAEPVFAGQPIGLRLLLERSAKRRHFGLRLQWPEGDYVECDLDAASEHYLTVYAPAAQRGLYRPGRLRVETVYPLGLLVAWSSVALEMAVPIYPKPIAGELLASAGGSDNDGDIPSSQAGADEFEGFRRYRPGDSLSQVYWQALAKGQPMQAKQYRAFTDSKHWLEWQQTSGDVELRLSVLCNWTLQLASSGQVYGLSLPHCRIEPGQGQEHLVQVLTALALFGEVDNVS